MTLKIFHEYFGAFHQIKLIDMLPMDIILNIALLCIFFRYTL